MKARPALSTWFCPVQSVVFADDFTRHTVFASGLDPETDGARAAKLLARRGFQVLPVDEGV
jgi:hypothetical protein